MRVINGGKIEAGNVRLFFACDGPGCDNTVRAEPNKSTGWLLTGGGQYCCTDCAISGWNIKT